MCYLKFIILTKLAKPCLLCKTILKFILFYSLKSHLDRLDITILIEMHFVYAHHTVVTICTSERMTVINDVPLVILLIMKDRMMSSTCTYLRITLEDLAYSLERAEGVVGNGLGHAIVRAGPAAL